MSAVTFRRNKLIKWIKKEAEKTELLLKTMPDSTSGQARADMLNALCKEFEIESSELQAN